MSNSSKIDKAPLKKETIRFFEEDVELIRETFPGGYGKPGINEVIRSVIHSWTDQKLRQQPTAEAKIKEQKDESA